MDSQTLLPVLGLVAIVLGLLVAALWLLVKLRSASATTEQQAQFVALQRQIEHNIGLIEVTRAINSTMNVPDLLGLIVDNVAALVQAQHGSLWLLDEAGTHLSIQAAYNLPNHTIASRFAIGQGIAGWVAQTGQSLISNNVRADPRYSFLPGNEHLRAIICVPLISRGHVIGVLSLDRYDNEPPFSDSEFRTVQDYAQHATLALTKARLMEAAQLQLDQLQAIYQLSDAVAQASSIDAVFQAALDTLLRTTHADRASILLYDADGVMRFKAWRGLSDHYRQHTEGHSPWPPGTVEPQPVLVEDVELDPGLAELRPVIVSEGVRAVGFIPLINQRQLLGKFMLYYNQPHHFSETQVAQTIAYHVSFAIVRLRAQLALRDSEARFRTLVESQGEGVSLIDPDENCRFANPAANTIFGVDNLVGRNLREFTSPDQFAQLRAQTERRRRGERSTYDLEIVRCDGEHRNLIATATPQLDAAGNFDGALVVWLDITERKQAEETQRRYAAELEAQNVELDAFAHTVAHDLKNPVGHIAGYLELLQLDYHRFSDEARLDIIARANAATSRLATIIDELLTLSRIRQAEVGVHAISMDIVVTAALSRLAEQIKQANATIIRPQSWPNVLGHVQWLEEVWVNYLSNALKYGGQPPRIELGFDQLADGELRFWVHDNGRGLSAEEQARLFVPFTRLSETVSHGHGLGLSIVRRITDKLGGQAGVESTPGAGTRFYFTLRPAPADTLPTAADDLLMD